MWDNNINIHHREVDFKALDGTGLRSCSKNGFGTSSFETSDFTTTVLVS